jgi:hypothetical protein
MLEADAVATAVRTGRRRRGCWPALCGERHPLCAALVFDRQHQLCSSRPGCLTFLDEVGKDFIVTTVTAVTMSAKKARKPALPWL